MNEIYSIFGIALFGSGGVAGYIIKWGIEKKKMKREYKQRLIKRWREYIDSDWRKRKLFKSEFQV